MSGKRGVGLVSLNPRPRTVTLLFLNLPAARPPIGRAVFLSERLGLRINLSSEQRRTPCLSRLNRFRNRPSRSPARNRDDKKSLEITSNDYLKNLIIFIGIGALLSAGSPSPRARAGFLSERLCLPFYHPYDQIRRPAWGIKSTPDRCAVE